MPTRTRTKNYEDRIQYGKVRKKENGANKRCRLTRIGKATKTEPTNPKEG